MDLKLKRNVWWKGVEAVVTIAASFAQLAIIARAYETSMVGQYQVTLAWLFFVSALSCFGGIVMITTRELSNNIEDDRDSIFSTAVVLQALIALPLGIASIWFFYNSSYFEPLALPLSVGTAAVLGATVLHISQALLVSKEEIARVVASSILGHSIATISIGVAALYGLSVTTLVAGWAAYHVANGLALLVQTRAWRTLCPRGVTAAELKGLAVEVFPVLIMVLATHLYIRIDVIMLDAFTTEEAVAQYSAGYLFLDQLMIVSNCMMSALFPNFARACLSKGTEYRRLYRGILALFFRYLVPIALVIAVFSRPLLDAIYGSEYGAAWPSLSILMLAAIFAWINGPSGTIFISLRKQHIYMWATLLSVLVNVVGNLLLIPLMGAVGAAISTVLTEGAICAFCLWWIYRETAYLPFSAARGI
jgi:O-antigen/teichoic acid export membrane protein